MKLTVGYLAERHRYWVNRISEKGIWVSQDFKDIVFEVRYNNKSFNGLFQSKYDKRLLKRIDKIVIYQNTSDMCPGFVDDVLVHEMIHQYIYQNNISDTSTHGKYFVSLMNAINNSFRGELNLSISSTNLQTLESGPGTKIYKIVIIKQKENFFCCKVRASKVYDLNITLLKLLQNKKIQHIEWCESNDKMFERYAECYTSIHGIKKPLSELESFKTKHLIKPVPIIEDL